MSEQETKAYTDYVLPASVVSKLDVARLLSEAERIDNDLTQSAVRDRIGATSEAQPATSERLTDFLQANELQLDDARQRADIIKQLHLLKDKAPIIHMTFAVEADPESLGQLAQWVRASVHPQAIIATGLQPALVAGVYLRTPNHVHDLSLRAKLKNSRDLLVKELEAARG